MLEKTYQPAMMEARRYRLWERSGVFGADPYSDKPPFAIMMPPPNVTGSLHMGHALTFTLQDVLVRYQRMRGCDVLWQPGTDHAGIATEIVVTNQLAEAQVNKQRLGRAKFIERVWEWKAHSGGTIINQLRRLGASPDWSRERFTMDPGLAAAVRKVFVQLYREGLIYRDKRLVNWDPEMHTVISDLEVDSRETRGQLWHIRYPIEGEPGRFLVVATTRPETMLGDTGVAVHPDDARFADLVGKQVRLPLVDRLIPIVADEYADPEVGTGAVKITPGHDFNDFEVGRRHGLRLINIFDRDAKIRSSVFDEFSWGHRAPIDNVTHADEDSLLGKATSEEIPEPYRGLDRFDVRKKIVGDLEALGLLDKVEDHILMVPHHERSDVVIEPWLMDQWYCNAAELARAAIKAVESGRTRFIPRQWENTFFEWLRNIQPWCISRQLWWGHRIPAWYGEEGAVFVAESQEQAAVEAEAKYGRPVILTQDDDVLDTWFSSALWPFSTLGWPEPTRELSRYYPTDVLVTGFDIIFFWVARMMMMGLHFMGEVPFRAVYIHALVRDARGQKMSKSRGNIIDPLELIDRYGCDALRFTLAALAAPGRDIKLAESRVEGYRNFVTKLWNAARYAEMNGCAFDRGFDPRSCQRKENRWIGSATRDCAMGATAALESFRFDDAANRLYQFVWGSFCDWYLEFSKPILQGSSEAAKLETRKTTAWVLAQIVHLLHPIMPFVTEELWAQIGGKDAGLLLTGTWPKLADSLHDPDSTSEMEDLIKDISAIRAARAELGVPPGASIPTDVKDAELSAKDRVKSYAEHFERLARIKFTGRELKSEVEGLSLAAAPGAADQTDEASISVAGTQITFSLRVGSVIDIAQEKARLRKEIGRLEADLARIAGKLANPNFLAKAKPEVVEEQREREAETTRDRDRLKAAYDRLTVSR
jgi:valyl-tRNA synthetase